MFPISVRSVLLPFFFELFGKVRKVGIFVLEEGLGRAFLKEPTLVQHQNMIALNDRVEPVGYGQHSGALELFVDQLLDRLLCDHINVRCCLIKEDNLVVSQNGPDNAEQLFLTNGQVAAVLSHFEVKTGLVRFLGLRLLSVFALILLWLFL